MAAPDRQHLVGVGAALPADRRPAADGPLLLVRRHDEPARRACLRPDGADAREPADQARLPARPGRARRSRPGGDPRVPDRRPDRQPHGLAQLLPNGVDDRLPGDVRARQRRPPAGDPAPARRPLRRLPPLARDAARSRPVAGELALHDASWWDHWLAWVRPLVRPPPGAGNGPLREFPAIEPAPGQYVARRLG